jgi:hypothetical protein
MSKLELPTNFIKADLTMTAVMTILALISQIALYFYLQHGGWQVVKTIFKF